MPGNEFFNESDLKFIFIFLSRETYHSQDSPRRRARQRKPRGTYSQPIHEIPNQAACWFKFKYTLINITI